MSDRRIRLVQAHCRPVGLIRWESGGTEPVNDVGMRDSDQVAPMMMPARVRENVIVTTFDPVVAVRHAQAFPNYDLPDVASTA